MVQISVVIPTYKCSSSIAELTSRLKNSLSTISESYEIIFVNDASPTNDWEIIEKETQKEKRVKGVNLSRNFGQHYAITAGLEQSTGDWIIVMDGDLQDRPEEITKLYKKALEGYDIVLAKRIDRQDSLIKRTGSKLFYKVFSYLTETEQDNTVANFGIYKKDVIKAVLAMKDNLKYFPTMIQWVGFNKTSIPVEHAKRNDGKSAYNFKSLFKLAMNNIIAFSNKPLKLFVKFGFIMAFISSVIAVFYFIKYLSGDINVSGYASLIISIWFLSGINIMVLGIVGIYVGKTFEKVKDRPAYIIKEKLNL